MCLPVSLKSSVHQSSPNHDSDKSGHNLALIVLNLNKPDPCEYHLGPKNNCHDYSYNTNTVHFHSLCIEHSKQFHLVVQLQYRCCKYQRSLYPTDYQTVPRNYRVVRNHVSRPDCSCPKRRTALIGANFVISWFVFWSTENNSKISRF